MRLTNAPDLNEKRPDIITSSTDLIPNTDGSWSVPLTEESIAFTTTQGSFFPVSSFFAEKPDSTQRLFVASTDHIYELVPGGAGTWTDRGAITSSTSGVAFCQFGSQTVYTSLANAIAASTTGAFSALGPNLKANCLATLDGTVLAANVIYNGVTIPDGVAISDEENITDFTPDSTLASLAWQVQLIDTPGPITAAFTFRNFYVVFKGRGMWAIEKVPAPDLWFAHLISADVGCISRDGGIVAGDRLYFMDRSGWYAYDGASVQSISDQKVTKAYLDLINPATYAQAHYDDVNKRVTWYGRGDTSNAPTVLITYSITSGEWGNFTALGSTYTSCCPVNGPSSSLITFFGGSILASQNRVEFSVAGTTTRIKNGLTPANNTAATIALSGDSVQAQTLKRVHLDATAASGTVTDTAYRGTTSTATVQGGPTSGTFDSDLKADLMVDGHFHKLAFSFSALTNWMGYQPVYEPSGLE